MVDKVQSGARPAAAAPAAPKSNEHTVKRGETLQTVAQQHKVSEDDLRRANPHVTGELRAGQTLTVPAPAAAAQAAAPAAAPASQAPAAPQAPAQPRAADAGVAAQQGHALSGQMRQQQLSDTQTAPADAPAPASPGPHAAPGAAPATANTTPTVERNATGPEVETLQTGLNQWRARNGREPLATDGIMGPRTRDAVKDYERESGIPNNNGAASPLTQDRLALENNANFQHLNENTRQGVLDRMNRYPDNQAARDNLTRVAQDPNFSRLSTTHQTQVLDGLERNPSDAAHTQRLQGLYGSANFRNLDDGVKTRTLNMMGQHSTSESYGNDMVRMVNNGRFASLGTQDQGRMLNVFGASGPQGRQALDGLLNRDLRPGQPMLTSRGSGTTGTLLQQLDHLSTTNLDSRMPAGANRATALRDVMREVGDPGHYINQSNRGTCAATGMSYGLAVRNPADYARLQSDLLTTGQSRLPNGDTVRVPADAWGTDNSSRSHGERLLQSSLMQYGRPGVTYSNNRPPRADGTNPTGSSRDGFSDGRRGLDSDASLRVMRGLYGQNHEYYQGSLNFTDDKVDITNRAQRELQNGHGPVEASMRWGTSGHRVEVTQIRDGRVYFRNPWGGTDPGQSGGVGLTGTNRSPPPRRVEDGHGGVESMSLADFRANVRGVYVQD